MDKIKYSITDECIAKSLTADSEMSELKKTLAVPHLSVLRSTINGLEYVNQADEGVFIDSISQTSGLVSVGKSPVSAFAIVPGDFGTGGRLNFLYDSETKKLTLGTSNENLLSVDCNEFVKDGMISSVQCITVDGQKVLRIVWNSDSQKEVTDIPVSSLVGGVYEGDREYINVDNLTIGFDSDRFKEVGLSDYDDIYLYCRSLSGEDGTIQEISDQISVILHDGKSIKYSAHINNASTISVGFVEYVRETLCKSRVPNGMFVPVLLDQFDGQISCNDGMVLGNGDVIIVHDHNKNNPYIQLEDLSVGENVRVYKAGVSRYEHVKNEQDIAHISNWIDGNFYGLFDQDSENIVAKKGLIVENLSVNNIHAENLDYEKVQLKVDGNEVVSVITSISETNGIISVEATQLEKSMVNGLTGTLDQLCAGLSTKIYIENPDKDLSGYSDLSVVKISKKDYDNLVSEENTNERTIYIVESNVIDAYGEKIVNVQDATDISDAVNLNVLTSKIDENTDGLSVDNINLYNEGQAVSVLTSISETRGVVSVGYSQLEKSMVNGLTGTLNDLCSGLSTKIYIENPDENLSGYSDLSVVKISKKDYDKLVSDEKTDERTIYIVESNVIDAYGEKIVNVQDATDISDAVNLNVLTSKLDEKIESLSIDQNIETRIGNAIEGLSVEKINLYNEGQAVSVLTSVSETSGIVSVEYSKLEQNMVNGLTGTLNELCAGLSTKIYIENPDDNLSDYSDLSVVKISKDDYELLVAGGNVNPRSIYIISSNVIDAYEQKIINVQDATGQMDAVNLRTLNRTISSAKPLSDYYNDNGLEEIDWNQLQLNKMAEMLSVIFNAFGKVQ